MIRFNCQHCGTAFAVKDSLGGRKARCKRCGHSVVIPKAAGSDSALTPEPRVDTPAEKIVVSFGGGSSRQADSAPTGSAGRPVAKKLPMRIRRLKADAEHLNKAFRRFPLIRVVNAEGDPPERYRIEYRIRGVARGSDGQPVYRDQHLVEIQLTSEYPRQSPKCRMLTPIFHPNIDPTVICVGDHWTAGEKLADLVIRIGEMIAYQAYNIKSPLDGEAAMWADLNQSSFPVDKRSLVPPDA